MNRLTARGAGIVMISCELPELLGMSDRIVVMHRGRIQAQLDAAEATEERVLSAALGLAGGIGEKNFYGDKDTKAGFAGG